MSGIFDPNIFDPAIFDEGTSMANEYFTNVDIGNRALQHLGATRITSFSDNSKNASAISFVYDKLRQAELRRNVWRFSIREVALRPVDTTTLRVTFLPWSATIAYQPGAIVADPSLNGVLWVSAKPFNLNLAPGTDPSWDIYYGPLTADVFTPIPNSIGSPAYYTGELVYETLGAGKIQVYSSLSEQNSTDPVSGTDTWAATTTYAKGQVTQNPGDSFFYISLIDNNLNNTPGTYGAWDSGTTYAISTIVGASDGNLYISMTNSNTNHNPIGDNGTNWQPTGNLWPWTTNFTSGISAIPWTLQYCMVGAMNIVYPLGSGPASQTFTRNIFKLPNGFLRQASNDPKQGSVSFLGAPGGAPYNDWNLEGEFLTSQTAWPIILRFGADMTQVSKFDPMFCEGLAARIAMETCEELTQAQDKLRAAETMYAGFMGQARTVNGIETGPTEPPEDDWLTTRV
jgi:hypothetical protein